MDIFNTARSLISESLIKKYFYSNDSFCTNREYFVKSPLRADKNAGSFCINLDTGFYIDNARPGVEGDFIDLVSKAFNISLKDAAEKIVSENSGIQIEKTEKKEKPKIDACLDVPESAFEKLQAHINSSFIVEKIGKPVKAWKYIADNKIWCVVVRSELNGNKTVKPYFFGSDNKWHSGNPLTNKRPLYNVDKLKENDLPVLIVEGEKCANVKVDGYNVISWIGGSGQILKSDWTPIENREAIFWADNDIPGYKCALELKAKYPNVKILDMRNYADKFDIYDTSEQGLDLNKIISEAKEYDVLSVELSRNNNDSVSGNTDNDNINHRKESDEIEKAPFKFLGYDENAHYFLPDGFNVLRRITCGHITKSKLQELAPLAWWELNFPKNTKNASGCDWDSAADWVIQSSMRADMFSFDRVRGSGYWFDGEKIVVNDGRFLYDEDGNKIKKSDLNHYVKSQRRIDGLQGEVCTREQGNQLIELFKAQDFESDYAALSVLGWCLVAPFCGLLKWRPHIWITGAPGAGKSYVFQNLIFPLVGDFRFDGSGKNTAASLYRSLKNDSCPSILDEMEPGENATKEATANIREIVEIARNASTNASAKKTVCEKDGSVAEYRFRSMCCFASVVPFLSGAAIQSRFILCRLLKQDSDNLERKFFKTKELLDNGVLKDPCIYRRKILRNFKTFLELIDKFEIEFVKNKISPRDANNLSPIFAALLIITDSVIEENIPKYVQLVSMYVTDNKQYEERDEEKLLRSLFDFRLLDDNRDSRSISEMLLYCDENNPESEWAKLLARNGLKFFKLENTKCLAVAQNSSAIEYMLNNTSFCLNYKEVIRRHESLHKETHTVSLNGMSKRCILLDWSKLKKEFFCVDKTKEVNADESNEELKEVL